jgi:hypothetical protein
MDYSNILNAINGQNPAQNSSMADLNRRNENYRLVDQLNQEGVSLREVLGQIDELKKKVESLEKPAKSVSEDLFLVMESKVRDNPAVLEAKKRLSDTKNTVLLEFCMKDPRFKEAYDGYRDTVNREYVSSHENGTEKPSEARKGAPEVCSDSSGSVQTEEGVQAEQTSLRAVE